MFASKCFRVAASLLLHLTVYHLRLQDSNIVRGSTQCFRLHIGDLMLP
jgi:hypothetical protein